MTCAVDGCTRRARARGWCQMHYYRWRTHGDPLTTLRPTVGSGRRVTPAGYIQIRVPGHPMASKQGYAMEHRVVLFDAGTEIPVGHHVHHINGDKQDNRPENLEVLSPSDHQREHVGEVVRNGHGVWPVLRDERILNRGRNARAKARRLARR